MKNRVMSFVLALLMVFMLFAGCSEKEMQSEVKEDVGEENKTNIGENKEEDNNKKEEEENNKKEEPKVRLEDGLTAEKIGELDIRNLYCHSGALMYKNKELNKYGIITFDGKQDTGAIYAHCQEKGKCFEVSLLESNNVEDINSLNCFGIVNAMGEEIIPMKYALINKLSDRYFQAFEITEKATNADEAVLTYDEGTVLFKANWYVYDLTSGKVVENLSGTEKCEISVESGFIKKHIGNKKYMIFNEKGEYIPEEADLLCDGYYALAKGNSGAVYDAENKKIFEYSLDGFVPYSSSGNYIVANRYDKGVREYILMDIAGNVVSKAFNNKPMVYGTLIYADEKIYDFQGRNIIEGSFKQVYFDEHFCEAWVLRNDNNYTMINKDGTVLYQGAGADDTIYFDSLYFNFMKRVRDKKLFYSLTDKDFTLEGSGSHAPWLIEVSKANGVYDIIDIISGKTIINGYDNYSYVTVSDKVIYVYARRADRGYDIYTVK